MVVGLVLMLLQEMLQRQAPPRIVAAVEVGLFPPLVEPQKPAAQADPAGAALCGSSKERPWNTH